MVVLLLLLCCVTTLTGSCQGSKASTSPLNSAEYAQLAEGVGDLELEDSIASSLILYGAPWALVTNNIDGAAIVAAVKYGSGRVLHFGHENMMFSCCSASGYGRLVQNAAAWAAGTKTSGIRVAGATDWEATDIVEKLVAQDPSKFVNVGIVPHGSVSTAQVDLYFMGTYDKAVGKNAAKVRAFVSNGGGLITGGHAWAWAYDNPVALAPVNLLLSPLGIYASSDLADVSASMDPASPPPQTANANVGLSCLSAALVGGSLEAGCGPLDDDAQLTAAMSRLVNAGGFIPQGTAFWKTLQQLGSKYSPGGIGPDRPVERRSADGLGAFARTILYKYLPPGKVPQAPDAKYFPGLPPKGTKPVNSNIARTVTATTAARYWQCLGTYAMPGTVVQVTVPASLATVGATLHIGGFTDTLYDHTQWSRLPEIVRWFPVSSTVTKIASGLGGLIYLTLPEGLDLGTVQVLVKGAIRAPMYVHGVTDPSSWASELKNPAPWGEIGSSKMVFATPTSSLRTQPDAVAVMDQWDKVLDAMAWLVGKDAERKYPERMQHDADISVGYMHSGYPIMTFMDVVDSTIDPADNEKWGQYHELGHNHQDEAWTWGATGEVTVNLFTAWAFKSVRGGTDPRSYYGGRGDDVTSRLEARAKHFAQGAPYSNLLDDPFLYLDSYLQVAEDSGLGFDLIRDTFISYQDLAEDESPSSDDEKLQMWVKQQSKVARLNLAPYFKAWGWPVSKDTEAACSKYPAYKPPSSG